MHIAQVIFGALLLTASSVGWAQPLKVKSIHWNGSYSVKVKISGPSAERAASEMVLAASKASANASFRRSLTGGYLLKINGTNADAALKEATKIIEQENAKP